MKTKELVLLNDDARACVCCSTALRLRWQQAGQLASYQQHDAHEFFLSLVAAVHTNLQASGSAAAGGGAG